MRELDDWSMRVPPRSSNTLPLASKTPGHAGWGPREIVYSAQIRGAFVSFGACLLSRRLFICDWQPAAKATRLEHPRRIGGMIGGLTPPAGGFDLGTTGICCTDLCG